MEGGGIISYIVGGFGLLAMIVAAVVVTRSSATKQTITTQAGLISAQSEKISFLEGALKDLKTEVGDLRSEQQAIKNIPLKDIAAQMKAISLSQEKILKVIEKNQ